MTIENSRPLSSRFPQVTAQKQTPTDPLPRKTSSQITVAFRVIVGGGRGQFRGGRVLDYLEKPNRKMCSLDLSLLDKFGIRLKEFGDSKEHLAEV